jgi:hypothetical protein
MTLDYVRLFRRVDLVSPTSGTRRMQDVFVDRVGRIGLIQDYSGDLSPRGGCEVVDLSGLTMIPGLIDSHVHVMATGLAQLTLNLRNMPSIAQIQERLRAEAESSIQGAWLLATELDEYQLEDKRPVTRTELDACCGSRPAFIEHRSLHFAVLNSEGIRRLGLLDRQLGNVDISDLDQGIVRGKLLSESRRAVMRGLDRDFKTRALQTACALAARRGATTLHAVEGGELFGDAYIPELLDLCEKLDTWIVLYWVTTDVEAARRMGLRGLGADVLLDGTLGSRTAALWEPYADAADTSGCLYKSQQEVDEFMFHAREAHMQPGVHAIGGRAVEQALNAVERAETLLPGIDNRPRVEHFGEATAAQIRRAGRLQMGVASQPPFAYLRGAPAGVYAERLGAERVKQVYAFRRMIDEGVRVAGGSDSPITPPDSMLGLHACVNAYHEAQRLSVSEALQLYTINGAWLGFEEGVKGDLKVGMNADMVVLDKNPFRVNPDQIREIEVLLTIKGGQIVFDGLGIQDHAENATRS